MYLFSKSSIFCEQKTKLTEVWAQKNSRRFRKPRGVLTILPASLIFAVNTEPGFEFFARNMNPIFDRTDRDFQFFGNFVVFKAPEMHHKRFAISVLQIGQRLFNVFHRESRIRQIQRRIASGIDVMQIIGGVNKGVSAHHSLIICNKSIFHNGVQRQGYK